MSDSSFSATLPGPPPVVPERNLSPAQWGMLSFLGSEVAFFSTLIAVYLNYLGTDQTGPTPAVLSLSLVIGTTLCLLSSSVTVHLAEQSLRSAVGRISNPSVGQDGLEIRPTARAAFLRWWSATIVLGILFLAGTAYEWTNLIMVDGLTISRNLFGTTYYTLVGFHAFHVTVGVIVMLIVLGLTLGRQLTGKNHSAVELVSWYWHFVDGVWVVVFTVVYVVGK